MVSDDSSGEMAAGAGSGSERVVSGDSSGERVVSDDTSGEMAAGAGPGGREPALGFMVRGQLLQEQAGRVFQAVVPMIFELENGDRVTREIWNTKRRQTFEYTLPNKVKRIQIAPDHSVYFRLAR